MTSRGITRSVSGRVALAIAVLMLMTGCEGAVEPTKYTTIDDAAAFASTRSEVKEIFDTAATTGIAALGSGEVRNGDRVVDVTCGEPYSKAFRELEIRGSFVADGLTRADVIERLRTAWEGQGWQVDVTGEDQVFLETKTSTGVRVIGSAPLQALADKDKVGVGLSVGTGCLKLPQSVVDDL